MEPGTGTPAVRLGLALKRWVRQGPHGPTKVGALAKRVGLSQSTLYAYLSGTTVPPAEVLDDLLQALGVPPEEQRRLATARDEAQRPRRGARPPADVPATDRAAGVRASHPVPQELPTDPAGFTGRTDDLRALDEVVDGKSRVPVSLVSGPAGVGKTALALRWGHSVAHRFPDGCLYLDLRGYSLDEPIPPGEALAALLRSLGVTEGDLPPSDDERAARFRSLSAGKRMLVVLDNALDVDQVRPLLPGGSDSLALVTSRTELTGLRVRPGAHQLTLAPLATEAALDLLRAQLPEDIPRRTAVVAALADQCGGLPLALRVVAAQAHGLSVPGLEALVRDLAGRAGLDRFEVGDPESSVRRVFSWSEDRLPPQAAEAFRLLGVPPVQDLDLDGVAALLGCETAQARARVDVLLRAHLVTVSPVASEAAGAAGPRYGMHDLLRQLASERATEEIPVEERQAATTRLVEHLVALGTHAVNVLHPPENDSDGQAAISEFPTANDAQVWLDREWLGLMSLVGFAGAQGLPTLARDLAGVLRPHLDQGGRHHDALTVLTHSLEADRLLGDRQAEGVTLRDLGTAHMRVGLHRAAMASFEAALDLARETGDRNGEAGTLNNLGNLHERLGAYDEAIAAYRLAVPIAVELAYRRGEATLHNNLGCVWLQRGEHEHARGELERALDLFVEIGDVGGTARARGNLGRAQLALGDVSESTASLEEALVEARTVGAAGIEAEALNALGSTLRTAGATERSLTTHESALALAREIGDRYEEALALEGLGHLRRETGDVAGARTAWREAWTVLDGLELDEADRVARLLGPAHEAGTAS